MNVFKNNEHQQQFERDGYVVVKAFDAATIQQMQLFFDKTTGENFSGFHNTLELHDPEVKKEVFLYLRDIFNQYLQKYFQHYKAVGCGFVTKKSDDQSRVYPHQDWTFVDESRYTSLNLWAPLINTNEQNGALKIFKGTHQLKTSMRGSNLPPVFRINNPQVLQYLTTIPLKAGEVIMYDHRLIHGSEPNLSGKTRVAASFNVVPEIANPIHYVGDKNNLSKVYEVTIDENFYSNYYLDKTKIANPAANHVVNYEGYSFKEVTYQPATITEEDIARLYTSKPKGLAAFLNKIFNTV